MREGWKVIDQDLASITKPLGRPESQNWWLRHETAFLYVPVLLHHRPKGPKQNPFLAFFRCKN